MRHRSSLRKSASTSFALATNSVPMQCVSSRERILRSQSNFTVCSTNGCPRTWRLDAPQQSVVTLEAGGLLTLACVARHLQWIPACGVKLRTLGLDYQYVRQSLPDKLGYIPVFESVLEEENLNLDYPFGALVQDIQVSSNTRAAYRATLVSELKSVLDFPKNLGSR